MFLYHLSGLICLLLSFFMLILGFYMLMLKYSFFVQWVI